MHLFRCFRFQIVTILLSLNAKNLRKAHNVMNSTHIPRKDCHIRRCISNEIIDKFPSKEFNNNSSFFLIQEQNSSIVNQNIQYFGYISNAKLEKTYYSDEPDIAINITMLRKNNILSVQHTLKMLSRSVGDFFKGIQNLIFDVISYIYTTVYNTFFL